MERRAKGELWNQFYEESAVNRATIFVECASLAKVTKDEERKIEELVERVFPKVKELAILEYIPDYDGYFDNEEDRAGVSESTKEQEAVEKIVQDILGNLTETFFGCSILTEHHIDVQGAEPVKHRTCRMSPKMLETAHETIEGLLEKGIIEKSCSAWSSARVMVNKPDGTVRFFIDYRDLNKVTKKDAYPIPSMDYILDKIGKYTSKIDLKMAYHQIPLNKSSKQYTAFSIPGSGLYTRTSSG